MIRKIRERLRKQLLQRVLMRARVGSERWQSVKDELEYCYDDRGERL